MVLSDAETEEMEAAVEWLKHHDDKAQVRAEMQRTAWYRRHFIQSPTKPGASVPSVTDILCKFPHLLDIGMVRKTSGFFYVKNKKL